MINLAGKNIVVLDCETKVAPTKDGPVGWKDYDKMGCSVSVTFDYQVMRYRVYMDDNRPLLMARLASADLVTGFNIEAFDLPLLDDLSKDEGTYSLNLEPQHIYDMLKVSRRGAGVDNFTKGFKLADHLAATLGPDWAKSGDGAAAPALWQQGKLGELISYCMDDVAVERALFEHIVEHAWLSVPSKARYRVVLPGLLIVPEPHFELEDA
jgi:hypothetical protein